MERVFRWRRRILFWMVATILVTAFVSDFTVDAAIAGQRMLDVKEEYTETVHSISKRSYDDKKYGDGSLKKFFIMLKIILTLFGKY